MVSESEKHLKTLNTLIASMIKLVPECYEDFYRHQIVKKYLLDLSLDCEHHKISMYEIEPRIRKLTLLPHKNQEVNLLTKVYQMRNAIFVIKCFYGMSTSLEDTQNQIEEAFKSLYDFIKIFKKQ